MGILARDEEAGIAKVIGDLREQTLFRGSPFSVEVHVVANGCTDRTADAAKQAFTDPPFAQLNVSATVHDIARPGKSNAWNTFIHEIVPDIADFVILLDGDIRIPEPHSLKVMVEALAGSPDAVVAVDRSIKDIELEHPRSIVEKLIKLATGTANDPRTAIAGACYCARYSELRQIWMPIGLPGEDGYLRAMLLTSSFSCDERLERHVFVAEAYHVFESLRGVQEVVRHNVRLAIGTAVNILLFGHLRKLKAEGRDLAVYVRERNAAEPEWVNALIRERLQASYFPLEPKFVTRRLRRIWNASGRPSIKAWAVAALGTAFDLIVFARATVLMRKGTGAGYW